MNEAMTDELKATWGPLAYVRGAMKVLPDLTRYRARIRYDGAAWEPLTALNVIVANGRSAGGGTMVAPAANPEDGLLDVVIVRPGTLAELTGVAARLLAGNYLNSDAVLHRRAKRAEIESTPGMWFNIDGELVTNDPITFAVVPRALRVIVGNGYSANTAGKQ
jgi:diacylglycerol kinase (ATP)